MSIKVLDDKTINQIAAGEVIENPASVVKELVDNALDAKSSHIQIEIKAGGFQLIRISDDGIGMSPDDAVLSLERHATSKISKLRDLLFVKSMGFRGEALASIASISKFTMITAKENKDYAATRVVVEGGRIQTVGTFSRKRGTTVEVRSLFYCVPARKKFQKSVSASSGEIYKMVCKMALARPDVHFELISNEKEALRIKPVGEDFSKKLLHVIDQTLGGEIKKHLLTVHLNDSYMKIHGFVADPMMTRQNKTLQHLFINQRAVESKSISLAALDGFGTMIATRRYPVFVLHIEMDPKEVDVNVHPQKKEIRFKDDLRVKTLVRQSISKALIKEPTKAFEKRVVDPFEMKGPVFEILEEKMFENEAEAFCSFSSFSQPSETEDLIPFEEPTLAELQDFHIVGLYKKSLILDAASCQKLIELPSEKPPYSGLFFVDLKKASARLFVESAMKGSKDKLSIQKLLFPIKLTFTKPEIAYLETLLPVLEEVGIELRIFSETSVVIEGLSEYLDENQLQDLIEKMMQRRFQSLERVKEAIATSASSCIKASSLRFTEEMAKKILSDLLKSNNPYFCPLGTKVIAYMSEMQYEKLFRGE